MLQIAKAIHEALGTESTVAFVLVVTLVFGVIGAATAWVVDRGYKNSQEYKDSKQHKAPIEPILAVGFGEEMCPLGIKPKTKIQVVIIQSDRSILHEVSENSGDKINFWQPSRDFQSGPIGKISASNRGSVDAFSIMLQVRIIFARPNDTYEEKIVLLPAFDLLTGGKSQEFYVVNLSSFPGFVQFSQYAEMQVQGEKVRRTIEVAKETLLPSLTFNPTITLDLRGYGHMDGVLTPLSAFREPNKKRKQ